MRKTNSLTLVTLSLVLLGAAAAHCSATDSISPSFHGSVGTVSMSAGAVQVMTSGPQTAASLITAGPQLIQSGFFGFLSDPSPFIPAPPSGLTAEALAGSRIALAWDFSPDADVTQYRLYYDNATGTINYTAPLEVFTAAGKQWTTPALTSGNTYKFGLRAVNSYGIEEQNTSVFASAQALSSLTGVRAAIKTPQTGKKINGNSATVMAEIILGASSQVRRVLFQYRTLGGGAWSDIAAANSNHPNPDTDAPYFVHWDADSMPAGTYELRAQATDSSNIDDPAPPTITVILGDPDYDTKETIVSGEQQKEQLINNAVTNTVQAADDGTSLLVKVAIPAGAVNSSTVTLTLVNNPASKPAPPAGAQELNLSVKINLSNGQSDLSGGHTATLTLSYKDDNEDGIVDGTSVGVDQLKLYYASSQAGPWILLDSTINKTKKTITGITSHFSFFAVFAGPAANLDTVRAYPVPFMPNDGKTDNGVPYSASDPNSGIIFDNLPSAVKIKIFTLSGQLVADLDTSNSQGKIQWDVKNNAGKKAASGGYLAVISSPGSKTITKKLLVVR